MKKETKDSFVRKARALLAALLTLVVVLSLSACDFLTPLSKVDTPDPQPNYTFEPDPDYVPAGMIEDPGSGMLLLKKLDAEEPVNEFEYIDDFEYIEDDTSPHPDLYGQAEELNMAIMNDKMPVFSNSFGYTGEGAAYEGADPESHFATAADGGLIETHGTVRLLWYGKYSESDEKITYSHSLIGVLQGIMKEDFTDYDKVLAIHDYISYSVAYDFEAYDMAMAGGEPPESMNSIMGAGYNYRAVCDGNANLFNVLCRLEGIVSRRVTGMTRPMDAEGAAAKYSDGTSVEEVGHAWNKVYIDAGGGEKEWYNVDTTYDRKNVQFGTVLEAYLSHAYFLLSDEDITAPFPTAVSDKDGKTLEIFQTRDIDGVSLYTPDPGIDVEPGAAPADPDETYPADDIRHYAAYETFEYFSDEYSSELTFGEQNFTVRSKAELNDVFEKLNSLRKGKDKSKYVGKIEFKLSYEPADGTENFKADLSSAFRIIKSRTYDAGPATANFGANKVVMCIVLK